MHPNKVFHTKEATENLGFAAARGFGVLAVNADNGPLISHIPFIVEGDDCWLHLVRSNPIARALSEPMAAVIAVSGPDSYISPDWYGIDDQVPTWNYVAVHIRGQLEARPAEELRSILDRESAYFEEKLAPKPPWLADKMAPDVLNKMMRSLLPCRIWIEGIQGTWKLGQNKTDEVRLRAADQVAQNGVGAELDQLAAMMRDP